MVDEFEQFRKRSYHGGWDVGGMAASETCHNLGRVSAHAGPPLKRSRSHPVCVGGKPRRCSLRPTTATSCAAQQPPPEVIITSDDNSPCPAPSGHLPEQFSNWFCSRATSINSALHSSINSLVLLPKINEYMASRSGGWRIPHHVRAFPAAMASRRKEQRRHMDFSTADADTCPGRAPSSGADSCGGAPHFSPKAKCRACSLQGASEARQFKVRIIGQQGVGKATLVRMFTAADEPYATNTENEHYAEGASVSVLQHGREDLLLLSCNVTAQVSDDDEDVDGMATDAFVVVYAVNDKHSFEEASKTVASIRVHHRDIPVVLIANKGDMVRSRVVKTKAGRDLAARHGSKYVEASALLNINVEELFLGVLAQMHFARERMRMPASSACSATSMPKRRGRPIHRAMGYIGKLFAKYREYENDIHNLFAP